MARRRTTAPSGSPRAARLPRLVGVAALLGLTAVADAQDLTLESRPTRWRFSIERFEATDDNDLGLAGLHYDVLNVAPDFAPGLYGGIGAYGAGTGTTGGLFFGGFTAGYLREMYPGWNLDVGLMAGGGGGDGADTGGGLFLRPHVAVERVLGLAALRLELVRLDFINGDIESTHLALGISLPGELLEADVGRQPERIPAGALLWRRLRITPTLTTIFPDDGTQKKIGSEQTDNVHLGGVEIDYFLDDTLYLPFEVAAATGGGVGGFTTAMTGIGGSWPVLGNGMSIEAKALIGAGGGGGLDTGGGFLWSTGAGVSWQFTRSLSLNVLGGYLSAPDGDLSGATGWLGLAWNPRAPELAWDYRRSQLERQGVPGSVAELDALRVQALHKTYFPSSSASTKSGGDHSGPIHMVGAGLQKPIELFREDFALTFKGFTAWDGGAGGYKEGTVGLQYELSPFANARFHTVTLRGEIGAGGGGDVDVRSGLLYHLAGGWRFQYSRDLAFNLDIGTVEADRGSFQGESFTVGLSYVLSRAVLR
jgi:hypothetical protein